MTRMVYIAHPISGDVEANVADLTDIRRDIHLDDSDAIPCAPYIESFDYLDDDTPEERQLGMEKNAEYLKRGVFDAVWLTGPELSSGMKEEVRISAEHDISVRYSPQIADEVTRFLDDEDISVDDYAELSQSYTRL